MKKSEEDKLDVLAAKKCKEHAGHMCVRCGRHSPSPEDVDEGLQWCHIISRSMKTIRWSLKNCLCLCAGCHFWGHKYPIDFGIWLIKSFGEEWYYGLKQTPKKKAFFDEIEKYLNSSKPKDCLIPTKHWEEELKL